jgi:hypothetical protein
VLGVDEGADAAGALRLGDGVQGERGLARRLGAEDLDDAAARQPPTPSATSSASEPVGITAISVTCVPPSGMMAPLPNCFSIAATAAPITLSLSRVLDIAFLLARRGEARPGPARKRVKLHRRERAAVRLPDDTRPAAGRSSGCRTLPARRATLLPRGVPAPILILDAFSLLYRAFFALPPLTTKAGEPTSALYGLTALLIKLLRERRPKGVAVARDLPRPTFRHQRYEHYKETRVAPPSALGRQVMRLGEILAPFGFPTFASPGFEADDVLATLASELEAQGETPMVVSGDRDALQLARGPVSVLYVARGVKGHAVRRGPPSRNASA